MRHLASQNSVLLRAAAASGRNAFQVGIDNSDKIRAYAKLLKPEEAVVFLNMYTEELNAITSQTKVETQRVLAGNASRKLRGEAIGGAIGLLLLMLAVALFLSR